MSLKSYRCSYPFQGSASRYQQRLAGQRVVFPGDGRVGRRAHHQALRLRETREPDAAPGPYATVLASADPWKGRRVRHKTAVLLVAPRLSWKDSDGSEPAPAGSRPAAVHGGQDRGFKLLATTDVDHDGHHELIAYELWANDDGLDVFGDRDTTPIYDFSCGDI
jgi:hypothetical protein